jgi:hypothetical protein
MVGEDPSQRKRRKKIRGRKKKARSLVMGKMDDELEIEDSCFELDEDGETVTVERI